MLDALFRCDVVLALQIEYLAVYKGGLNAETMSIGEFPVYAALTMLVIDCVLYLLLAVLFAGMLLTVLLILCRYAANSITHLQIVQTNRLLQLSH